MEEGENDNLVELEISFFFFFACFTVAYAMIHWVEILDVKYADNKN